MLREHNEVKEEIKNPETSVEYALAICLISAEKGMEEMVYKQ